MTKDDNVDRTEVLKTALQLVGFLPSPVNPNPASSTDVSLKDMRHELADLIFRDLQDKSVRCLFWVACSLCAIEYDGPASSGEVKEGDGN